jgi:hydroxymethylpyrimidine/phosphomethylpyrimidine kinase
MLVALTIAGSDPSGGAGIQADLKTFHQFGVYGEAVITLLTAQNTRGIQRVEVLPADLVSDQLQAVLEDIPPAAVKTGALGSAEIVRTVARAAAKYGFPLVVDPILSGTHGQRLSADPVLEAIRDELLPQATLVTPNIPEAEALTGLEIHGPEAVRHAVQDLHALGPRAVLLKGGHLPGDRASDVLFDGAFWKDFDTPRLETRHTHGTGCTLSAAITAGFACGLGLNEAVARAKQFVQEAIRTAPGIGKGCGPLNHHARLS